jgi:2-polyprenyl-6-methoxyphenol hydroxylase-like FAD-dependent oxidoreductase
VLEPGIPASGGILRPVLHRILSQRTVAEGATVRLGVTIADFAQDEGGVTVRFTDGREGRYDAIVGADGAHSQLRQRLFPNAPPLTFTGQGCWRLLAPRPSEVAGAQIYFGPGNVKVGITPCSQELMYLFATLAMPGNPHITNEELPERMRAILAPFGGRLRVVREAMGPESSVNYRPLFTMMLPPPWHEGRVGLIGDAVHPTTPHLASGAGLAVEDGLILAIEMIGADSVEAGWRSFTARRYDRAAMVVENSSNIAMLEQAGGREDEVRALMGAGAHALAAPI